MVAALAAFVLARAASGVVDLDLFHEMALAREIWNLGYVPWTDSFAYTPTVEIVVHHEWGLGVIALLLSRVMGGTGIILLKYALILGLGIVVWNTARRRHARPVILAGFMTLAIVLSDWGFATVRAQMFSYLFAALLLAGFDHDRKGDRTWLIGVALLFPLWPNLHGGCLVGAALLAVHWVEQVLRRQPHWHLFAMGLALIPLVAINPWGFHFHTYLIHAITMPRPAIPEWSPLWDPATRQRFLTFGISLLPLALILKETGWRKLPGILILIATGLAAIKSNRFLPFYAIAYASYLPGAFSRISLGWEIRRAWRRYQPAVRVLLIVAIVGFSFQASRAEPWRLQVAGRPLPHHGTHLIYPVGAVNYLQEQAFVGNVMVPYDWGSYVMWKMGPTVKISFDSRFEVAYPVWRLDEDDHLYEAREGWGEVLGRYPTDVILIRSDFKLARVLDQSTGWQRVYSDPAFILFARPGLKLPAIASHAPPPNGEFP